MKVSDEEVERIAEYMSKLWHSNGVGVSWKTITNAILSDLPEPTRPDWATPEAKAVLDAILPENWEPMNSAQWYAIREAYIAPLKPKTIALPERWYCECGPGIGGGIVTVACSSEAEVSALRAARYPRATTVRYVPAQQVAEEKWMDWQQSTWQQNASMGGFGLSIGTLGDYRGGGLGQMRNQFMAAPRPQLGPKQIAWCEKNIPHFATKCFPGWPLRRNTDMR